MKTIAIAILSLLLVTTVSAYVTWNDVINDYSNLIIQTGITWEEATSMNQIIDRIFYMKVQLLKPKERPRTTGGGSIDITPEPEIPIEEPVIEKIGGDANGDGKVDGGDLAVYQINYDPLCENENTWEMGDWNEDGCIDGGDLAIYQQNYNPLG